MVEGITRLIQVLIFKSIEKLMSSLDSYIHVIKLFLTKRIQSLIKFHIIINIYIFFLLYREADQFMPHRTIVDFVIIINNNNNNNNDQSQEDPTHHLFQTVGTSKTLDGMPVLPTTLTVNGIYL